MNARTCSGVGTVGISPHEQSARRYVGKEQAPFPIIGDPTNPLYQLYGLEKSWRKLFKTFITPKSLLATVREGLYATFLKGFWPGKIDAGVHRMPADFLIGPDQIVKKVHYGNYPGDHLPFEEIDQLLEAWPVRPMERALVRLSNDGKAPLSASPPGEQPIRRPRSA